MFSPTSFADPQQQQAQAHAVVLEGAVNAPVETLTRGVMNLLARFSDSPLEQPRPQSRAARQHQQDAATELAGAASVDEKKRAYQDFVDKLKELRQEDPEIISRIGSFLELVSQRSVRDVVIEFEDEDTPGAKEPFAEDIRAFLSQQARDMSALRYWRNCSEAERHNLNEGLEKLVLTNLHKCVFAPTHSHQERDDALSHKLKCLALAVDPVRNLDLHPNLLVAAAQGNGNGNGNGDDEDTHALQVHWERACNELLRLGKFKSPREKMACISNCCRVIIEAIRLRGLQPIPDVLIPALVYIVLRANPPQLNSNVEYIAAYRNPEYLMGEKGQFFMHFASAVGFLWRADHTALSMDEDEFHACFAKKTTMADSLSTPSTPPPPVAPTLAPKHRYTDAWCEERFRFEHVTDAGDLKLAQVSELLAEYHELIKACRGLMDSASR